MSAAAGVDGLAEAVAAFLARAPELQASALGRPPRITDLPPAAPVYPYVHIGRAAAEIRPGPIAGSLTVTVVTRFGGRDEAIALVALIRTALYGAEVSLADGRRAALRVTFDDIFRASDWRLTYGVLRVRAAVEPVEARAAA